MKNGSPLVKQICKNNIFAIKLILQAGSQFVPFAKVFNIFKDFSRLELMRNKKFAELHLPRKFGNLWYNDNRHCLGA